MSLGKLEKVEIWIDPENNQYKANINYVSLNRLEAALKDLLKQIENGTLVNSPGIETTEQ